MPPRIKRRKSVRKEQTIHVRLTSEQKQTLTAEAERAGLGTSSWLLMLGLREVEANTNKNLREEKAPRGANAPG